MTCIENTHMPAENELISLLFVCCYLLQACQACPSGYTGYTSVSINVVHTVTFFFWSLFVGAFAVLIRWCG